MQQTNSQVSIFGVPTDVGAGRRGASMGPEGLRVAGLVEALIARGVDVDDLGDLKGPKNPWTGPREGYRHLDEVVAWNRAVLEASSAELARGRMPIMLGGDHCLAIGSIAAVANHCRATGRKLRVLWLDAHTDFNTSQITPSGNVHGMPVACLCGIGPDELTGLGGVSPSMQVAQFRQIGIRSVDPDEKRLVKEHGLDIYDMRYIDEVGMRRVVEEALDGLDDDTHLHVSFDVDVLDPTIAPGTGTPVPGGINYREAQLVMEMIADSGRLGSLDIVEVNTALDQGNTTAELAVDLVESLFGKSTLMRD
ncbi:arginase [Luteimonas fraxinea]|uniref:Arginase n=1 Tax=Luteimonas fraxinea TaxID=2901869 RepID=A0ABS8UGM7_9GAMM|nr:arginase [Luteimonas fraxinea]MCD9098655.1 arginase [Luteimonas fraxinea]UHH08946.1 arginase [Luteimonas fraxinea]